MKNAYVSAWKWEGHNPPQMTACINQRPVGLQSGAVMESDITAIANEVIGGNVAIVHTDYSNSWNNTWATAASVANPDLRVQIVFHEVE